MRSATEVSCEVWLRNTAPARESMPASGSDSLSPTKPLSLPIPGPGTFRKAITLGAALRWATACKIPNTQRALKKRRFIRRAFEYRLTLGVKQSNSRECRIRPLYQRCYQPKVFLEIDRP